VGYLCANFSLPIGLSVLNLGPMYATDRQTDRRQMRIIAYAPYSRGRGHNKQKVCPPLNAFLGTCPATLRDQRPLIAAARSEAGRVYVDVVDAVEAGGRVDVADH